jgi:elongator complex protein 1
VNGAQEEIVDLRYLSTTASLCCILSGGDIVLIKTDAEEYDEQVEIIGNMEGGVLAAQWTLDEEILAIASGSTTLTAQSCPPGLTFCRRFKALIHDFDI